MASIIDSSATPSIQNGSSPATSAIQRDVIVAASAAFLQLPNGDSLFQQCLASPNPIRDIIDALEKRQAAQKSKKYSRFLVKFQQYTQWLRNFSRVIDVVVQTNAGIGCPIWAPIKFILELSQYHTEVAELIENIIDVLITRQPRLELYQKLSDDPLLQTALLKIFSNVTNAVLLCLRHFKHSSAWRLGRLLSASTTKKFATVVANLEADADEAHRVAVAAELLRQAQHRTDDVKIKFEAWLRPANFRERYNAQIEKRLTGTCDWVLHHDSFQKWINTPSGAISSDRLLCISGQHGCGKSVIAAFICDHLKSQGHCTLYFPFSGIDANQRNLDDLVRCLLWQAAINVWDDDLTTKIRTQITSGQPLSRELWDLFSYCICKYQSSPVYCIIDGLDECRDSSIDLFKQLTSIATKHQDVRAIILGRPHSMTTWPDTIRRLEINSLLNQDDIEAFVKSQFDNLEVVESGDIRESALRTLRDKSNGMFLWVQLMIDHLGKSASRMEVKQRLKNLPSGLQGAYRHAIQQMVHDLDATQLDFAKRILSFVIAAQRTMTVSELQYALAVDAQLSSLPEEGHCLEDFMMVNPGHKIPSLCRGFLEVSATAIKVVHFSAIEFLVRSSEAVQDEPEAIRRFFITDISEAHGHLARASLHYLSEEEYNREFQNSEELAETLSRHNFLAYSSDYLVYHYNRTTNLTSLDFSCLESFLLSQKSSFWYQKLGFTTMENVDFQMGELSKIMHTIQRSYDDEQQFFGNIAHHLFTESDRRQVEFGDDDLRTLSWNAVLLGLANCFGATIVINRLDRGMSSEENISSDDASTISSNHSPQFSPEMSDDIEESASSSNQQPNTAPSIAALEGMHNELLALARAGEPFALSTVPNAIKKALVIAKRMKTLRIEIDPSELLFRAILRLAPKIPARILFVVSKAYQGMGKLSWSLELCQIALLKMEDAETLLKYEVLHAMAHLQDRLACHIEALTSYQSAYYGLERLLGFSHPLTVRCFAHVVWQLYRLGRSAEIESHHHSAPDGWEEICFKTCSAEFFSTMDAFIALYNSLEDQELTNYFCLKVCEKTQDLLKATEVDPIATNSHLRALSYLGRYEEAIAFHPALMDRQIPQFQRFDTADWCIVYGQLSGAFSKLGKLTEAEKVSRLAAELGETLVRSHVETRWTTLLDWIVALHDLGRFDEVQRVGRKFLDENCNTSLRTADWAFRSAPKILIRSLLTIASAFQKTGDCSNAIEIFQRCIAEIATLDYEVYEWVVDHDDAHAMLVSALLTQKSYSEAVKVLQGYDFSKFRFEKSWESLIQDAVGIENEDSRVDLLNVLGSKLESIFGGTRQTMKCQLIEAQTLANLGRFPAASLLLDKVLSQAVEIFGLCDNIVIETRQWQAWILSEDENWLEAQKLLLMIFKDAGTISSLPQLDLDVEEWCYEAHSVLDGYLYGSETSATDCSEQTDVLSIRTSDGAFSYTGLDKLDDEMGTGTLSRKCSHRSI